jgi:hypothetical protein
MKNDFNPQELQAILAEKQAKLASIVGPQEAQRLMDRALKMIMAGKKSITDVL